jgi:hypothetical protein
MLIPFGTNRNAILVVLLLAEDAKAVSGSIASSIGSAIKVPTPLRNVLRGIA